MSATCVVEIQRGLYTYKAIKIRKRCHNMRNYRWNRRSVGISNFFKISDPFSFYCFSSFWSSNLVVSNGGKSKWKNWRSGGRALALARLKNSWKEPVFFCFCSYIVRFILKLYNNILFLQNLTSKLLARNMFLNFKDAIWSVAINGN